MRLRQVALVAEKLEAVTDALCGVLGVEIGYRDPGVAVFGLENAVMPIGDGFLEVVSPVADDAPARRYRERRGGDAGYMVMVQTDRFEADRARLDAAGVRVVWQGELPDIRGMHLHPKDTGGALLSLDEPVPAESWRWAGPAWHDHVRRE
ncbi:MAG TPA: VOC family protein, partial [Myxococcota bacterium]|nr:VOC family protein [Myxococcota bacterium]